MLSKMESSFLRIRGIPRTNPRVDGKAHNGIIYGSLQSLLEYWTTGLLGTPFDSNLNLSSKAKGTKHFTINANQS